MNPTLDGLFTTCHNIEYEATFLVFDTVIEYVLRKRPVYRGTWLDMPCDLCNRRVEKFFVEADGKTIYVWVREEV